jgi:hypothetical protein
MRIWKRLSIPGRFSLEKQNCRLRDFRQLGRNAESDALATMIQEDKDFAPFPEIRVESLEMKPMASIGTIIIMGDGHTICRFLKIIELCGGEPGRQFIEIHWMIPMGAHIVDMARPKNRWSGIPAR